MIVDSSALVTIARKEDGYQLWLKALVDYESEISMSSGSYLEVCIVIDRLNDPIVRRRFERLVADLPITVEPFTESQAKIARQAYADFGRGSNHPANLNFGDCFAYALASEKRQPILYKGTDFQKTDLRNALAMKDD